MIAASGTLAQIIPPSLVLIVMADQLGRSVGDMYEGAFIPGLVLAGALRRATCSWSSPGVSRRRRPACRAEAVGFREAERQPRLLTAQCILLVGAVSLASSFAMHLRNRLR